MVSKSDHTKALTDVLDYASAILCRDFDKAKHVDISVYNDYERAFCRFNDGFGITVILDWHDEDGD